MAQNNVTKEEIDFLNKKLLEIAREYIKDCHVIGPIHVTEGTIINLDSFLVDFLPYLEDKL